MRNFILVIWLLITVSVYSQTSSEKLIRQGVSMHDKRNYREAIKCYKLALDINPESMSATYEMSLSYLELKDFDNAMKYSTKVINANFQPLLMDAYIVKSTALAESNKLDQSIKLLNEAVERCGDSYLLHFNLGLSFFNKKDYSMAIAHLRKAIEIDATHSSAFLLYAYALNDTNRWVQSLYAFHFFLLLEPNTDRSKDAFGEMFEILTTKLQDDSPRLNPEEGVNRKNLYESIHKLVPILDRPDLQFKFFEDASKAIFFGVSQQQDDSKNGLLWNFFVPTYEEILGSGYLDAYCRYVSVAYFPESLVWWNNNKDKVDSFIEWFEHGQGTESDGIEGDDDSEFVEE